MNALAKKVPTADMLVTSTGFPVMDISHSSWPSRNTEMCTTGFSPVVSTSNVDLMKAVQ